MGPGEGDRVSPAMTLKVGDRHSPAWSMFEVVDIGPGSMMYVRVAAHTRSPTRPGPGPHDLPGFPSGHEHYQKELAELVAGATGPLDAAIAELRARHDIDQLTAQVMPGRP